MFALGGWKTWAKSEVERPPGPSAWGMRERGSEVSVVDAHGVRVRFLRAAIVFLISGAPPRCVSTYGHLRPCPAVQRAQIWPKCSQNATKMLQECCANATKMLPRCSQHQPQRWVRPPSIPLGSSAICPAGQGSRCPYVCVQGLGAQNQAGN